MNIKITGMTAGLGLMMAMAAANAGSITDNYVPLVANNNITRTTSTYPNPGTPFVTAVGVEQTILFQAASPAGALVPTGGNGTNGVSFDQLAFDPTNRYLFTVTETNGNSAAVRFDKQTGTTVVISQPAAGQRFDMARFTPWGTFVMAEEATKGRLFEVVNPLGDPNDPVVANRPTTYVRPAVSKMAHEGFARDAAGNIYVADENLPGALLKFVPTNPNATGFDAAHPENSPLAAGQLFALAIASPTTVATGTSPSTAAIGGTGTWVALNNPDGTPLTGITDPTVDSRATVAALNATGANIAGFFRPEDIDIEFAPNGKTFLYTGATGAATPDLTGNVLSIELTDPSSPVVRVFAGQNTIDAATGLALGRGFVQPDNVAVSPFGRGVCFVEDIGNSSNPTNGNAAAFPNNGNNPVDDVFCAVDANHDGVAESVSRLAILATNFAEPTGLIFDPVNPNRLYVNVQHAAAGSVNSFGNFVVNNAVQGNDLIVQFDVPEPATIGILGLGLAGLIARRRR